MLEGLQTVSILLSTLSELHTIQNAGDIGPPYGLKLERQLSNDTNSFKTGFTYAKTCVRNSFF